MEELKLVTGSLMCRSSRLPAGVSTTWLGGPRAAEGGGGGGRKSGGAGGHVTPPTSCVCLSLSPSWSGQKSLPIQSECRPSLLALTCSRYRPRWWRWNLVKSHDRPRVSSHAVSHEAPRGLDSLNFLRSSSHVHQKNHRHDEEEDK